VLLLLLPVTRMRPVHLAQLLLLLLLLLGWLHVLLSHLLQALLTWHVSLQRQRAPQPS
jgi:hypothetical protein